MFERKIPTKSITLYYCAVVYDSSIKWEAEPVAISPTARLDNEVGQEGEEFDRDFISLIPVNRSFQQVRHFLAADRVITDLAPLAQYIDAWREDGTSPTQRDKKVNRSAIKRKIINLGEKYGPDAVYRGQTQLVYWLSIIGRVNVHLSALAVLQADNDTEILSNYLEARLNAVIGNIDRENLSEWVTNAEEMEIDFLQRLIKGRLSPHEIRKKVTDGLYWAFSDRLAMAFDEPAIKGQKPQGTVHFSPDRIIVEHPINTWLYHQLAELWRRNDKITRCINCATLLVGGRKGRIYCGRSICANQGRKKGRRKLPKRPSDAEIIDRVNEQGDVPETSNYLILEYGAKVFDVVERYDLESDALGIDLYLQVSEAVLALMNDETIKVAAGFIDKDHPGAKEVIQALRALPSYVKKD